jgi:PST family polysaccharide transporter
LDLLDSKHARRAPNSVAQTSFPNEKNLIGSIVMNASETVTGRDSSETPSPEAGAVDLTSLDRSVWSGLAWTGAARWTAQALSWASTLVVVRLLTPTDYGIVGMASAFVAILQPVCDLGVGAAVVQNRSLSKRQIDELHGFAILVGLACTIVASALARPVADFFGEPVLRSAVPVMSLTFVLGSFRAVPTAMLSRHMRFRRLAFIDAAEALCVLGVSIGLALAGRGFWSLVMATVVSRAFSSALSMVSSPQRIRFPTAVAQIARSVRFGTWVAMSSLAWYVYTNADRVVLGRFIGDAALGAYVMALSLTAVPVDKVAQLYQRVAESVISRVQHDAGAVSRYLLGITEAVAVLSFPLSVGLMLVADHFVRAMLGPAWEPCIVPLRILAAAAALRSLDPLLAQVLITTGHASVNARSMALATVVLPGAFWVGSHWGVAGVALVWLIGHPVIVMTRQLWCVLRISNTRFVDYLGALIPAVTSTALMALAVLGCRAGFSNVTPAGVKLVYEVASGVVAYVASILVFHSRRVRGVLALVRQRDGAVAGRTLASYNESGAAPSAAPPVQL